MSKSECPICGNKVVSKLRCHRCGYNPTEKRFEFIKVKATQFHLIDEYTLETLIAYHKARYGGLEDVASRRVAMSDVLTARGDWICRQAASSP